MCFDVAPREPEAMASESASSGAGWKEPLQGPSSAAAPAARWAVHTRGMRGTRGHGSRDGQRRARASCLEDEASACPSVLLFTALLPDTMERRMQASKLTLGLEKTSGAGGYALTSASGASAVVSAVELCFDDFAAVTDLAVEELAGRAQRLDLSTRLSFRRGPSGCGARGKHLVDDDDDERRSASSHIEDAGSGGSASATRGTPPLPHACTPEDANARRAQNGRHRSSNTRRPLVLLSPARPGCTTPRRFRWIERAFWRPRPPSPARRRRVYPRQRKRPSLGSSEGEGAYARGRLLLDDPQGLPARTLSVRKAEMACERLRRRRGGQHPQLALPRRGGVFAAISHDARAWNAPCVRLEAAATRFWKQGGWGMQDAQWKTCAMKTGKILDWHRRRHWSHAQHGFPGNSDGGLELDGVLRNGECDQATATSGLTEAYLARRCTRRSVFFLSVLQVHCKRSPIRTTPMPSPSTPSSGSPITRLPYDILQEIFTDCLLRYPLHRRQPSTTTAPILLCHICSSWRMFALASPTLWTHLSYCFTIVEYIDTCNSRPRRLEFAERDFEFIRWWRTHQGQIAPFLSFDVDSEHLQRTDISQNFSKNSITFLVEYLISAQYLDLDMFCWKHEGTENNPFFELQTLISPHAFPVRCLSLAELSRSTPPNNLDFLHHWSTLTHLSLHISISLDFWLSLFHAVPHLRWAYFDIATGTRPFGISADTPTPPQCTLLELTTLTVAVRGRHEPDSVFPLSSLFTALHLPALRTLALSPPGARAWEDPRALRELYTVLRSTPAVTTLALEDTTLSFDVRALPTAIPALPGVEPIWAHAPALAHLTLALPVASSRHRERRDAALALFVRHVFSADSGWLDLRNPGCPIRAVTLSNGGQFHRVCDSVMASVRENAAKAPNVAFGITSDSAGTAAVDMRKEWGRGCEGFTIKS
ncbi:hypothetical protein BJ912DRAFT_1147064 [Pholiota molesta]|nr:hypothetical protein BJ912DRAFT_1147064 [Pholiota molesta]